MKKIHVPRCRINENLFIIDSTPTEDTANNRFGLNSEKTITLLATALQRLLVVTCRTKRNCWNCQKIFVPPKLFLSVLTISLGIGSIMNNIIICTYDNFTPHIPYFLYFPVYFGLTFVELDPEVIISIIVNLRRLDAQ